MTAAADCQEGLLLLLVLLSTHVLCRAQCVCSASAAWRIFGGQLVCVLTRMLHAPRYIWACESDYVCLPAFSLGDPIRLLLGLNCVCLCCVTVLGELFVRWTDVGGLACARCVGSRKGTRVRDA